MLGQAFRREKGSSKPRGAGAAVQTGNADPRSEKKGQRRVAQRAAPRRPGKLVCKAESNFASRPGKRSEGRSGRAGGTMQVVTQVSNAWWRGRAGGHAGCGWNIRDTRDRQTDGRRGMTMTSAVGAAGGHACASAQGRAERPHHTVSGHRAPGTAFLLK